MSTPGHSHKPSSPHPHLYACHRKAPIESTQPTSLLSAKFRNAYCHRGCFLLPVDPVCGSNIRYRVIPANNENPEILGFLSFRSLPPHLLDGVDIPIGAHFEHTSLDSLSFLPMSVCCDFLDPTDLCSRHIFDENKSVTVDSAGVCLAVILPERNSHHRRLIEGKGGHGDTDDTIRSVFFIDPCVDVQYFEQCEALPDTQINRRLALDLVADSSQCLWQDLRGPFAGLNANLRPMHALTENDSMGLEVPQGNIEKDLRSVRCVDSVKSWRGMDETG